MHFFVTKHCLLYFHLVLVALQVRSITCSRSHFIPHYCYFVIRVTSVACQYEPVRMVKPYSISQHNSVFKLLNPNGYCVTN